MFLLLPTGVNYRTERFPVITFGIMGLNVLVYLVTLGYTLAKGDAAEEWILENFWLTPATASWYQYLTAMFVHAGFFHLLGNMIYLFLFGSSVEDAIGRWKYVIFYLLGGVAADFVHIAGSAEHFGSEMPMGGASGAISACMGGFLLLFHRTRIIFRYFIFIFFRLWSGEFEMPAWLVVSFWFLKDLALAILTYGNGGGGVAFAAHSGGFVAGLGLVAANKLLERRTSAPDGGQEVVSLRFQPIEAAVIYVFDAGAQHGPFTMGQILQMQKLGSISAEAVFWQDGMPEWRSIAEIPDSM